MTVPTAVEAKASSAGVAGLRRALRGELIVPDDARYEAARRVWNGYIDRHPAFIVRCASVDDVRRALEFGRARDLEIAVRGGAHSFAGFSTCDGGLVIDLSPMNQVQVDPRQRTARAGAGAKLGGLISAAEPHGLMTTTGTNSDTGLAGLTLGGGLGWLMGKHGLTCDNVQAFDMVTAGGRLVRAAANENQDLYWGLRGGGGNFGIVTAFEYRLHPLGQILGGWMTYPMARARDVLRLYRELTAGIPDELTAMCILTTGPDGQPIVCIAACYSGDDLAEGERLITSLRKFGPLLADEIRPMRYSGLFVQFDAMEPAGRRVRLKESGLRELSDGAIDALAESARERTSPISRLVMTYVHGAAIRVGTSETAFAHREAHYQVLHGGIWEDAAGDEQHTKWVRQSWQALQQYASEHAYVNFITDVSRARVRAAYGPNYERLVALKRKYDPANVFHLNQNIQPVNP